MSILAKIPVIIGWEDKVLKHRHFATCFGRNGQMPILTKILVIIGWEDKV